MKKDLSVLMLLVRNSFWRVIGTILVMLVIESFFFFADADLVHGYTISLEQLLNGKIIGQGIFTGINYLLTVLATFGSDKTSKESYTLRRLLVSERRIWAWQAIYHTVCFLVIYIAEAWLMVSLCRYYLVHSTVQQVSDQVFWVAITRNTFLSNLLPLQNPLRMLRNSTLILGLGLTSAAEPLANRKGKSAFVVYHLLLLAMLTFVFDIKAWQLDTLVTMIAILLAAYATYYVWKGEQRYGSQA